MRDTMINLLRDLPHLLDFPLTLFLVWVGLKVWREAKALVVRSDERHQQTLRDIADKTDRALGRVTEGMRSIREEVRVSRAEVYARFGVEAFRGPGRVVLLDRRQRRPEAGEKEGA
ncbi:MAG TPA: hypothetical protein VMV46_21475 [Thermoanaerobaculia bacterium]|nr:hypothetical protein [Thermoanaerobaculia bacterium]